jgi:hypothetical protein
MLKDKNAGYEFEKYFKKNWGLNGCPDHAEILKKFKIDKISHFGHSFICDFNLSGTLYWWELYGELAYRYYFNKGNVDIYHKFKDGE